MILTWAKKLKQHGHGLLLVGLFIAAGGIRLYRLEAPGLLIEREYRSAILARAYYFEHTDLVPAWRKTVAAALAEKQPTLEPPLTERLVSWLYRLVGSEQMKLARLLTITFWLIGGAFLYALASTLSYPLAALLATAYYLFLPLSILISRSFQPDSLMMLLYLISLYLMVRYFDRPSLTILLLAALVSGFAILYRPHLFFIILLAFAALSWHRYGFKNALTTRYVWLFFILTLVPATAYYGYGILLTDRLDWKVTASFLPHLFLTRQYWQGWFEVILEAISLPAILTGLIGIAWLKPQAKAMVIGLGSGYLLYCLVFNFNIHFANYYHLQLIPLVALSSGALLADLFRHLQGRGLKPLEWLPIAAAIMVLLASYALTVQHSLGRQQIESQATAETVGEIVGHSTEVVYLATFYGDALQYLGELGGAYWPRASAYWLYQRGNSQPLTVAERLAALDFTPRFFVITDMVEYESHHNDLALYLTEYCHLIAADEAYLIYGDCLP